MKGAHDHTLDDSKFSRHHLKAIVVAGVGFLADQYDLFIINLIVPMVGYVYFASNANQIPTLQKSMLTAAVNLGAIVGQLGFGYLADKFGRKNLYGTELMIIITATLAGALCGGGPHLSVVFTLGLWRLIQGVGIGGDYPMSATIAAEFANVRNRGAIMAAVFSMQGIGLVFGVVVALIILPCFKTLIDADVSNFDSVWRILMAIGLLPAFAALYFRLTIPESPRFTSDVMGDLEKAHRDANQFLNTSAADPNATSLASTANNSQIGEASSPASSPRKGFVHGADSFRSFFGVRKNAVLLLGTAGNWFLIDIALYGLGLNNSIILQQIGFAKGSSPYDSMLKIVLGNLIISLLGNLPGYFVAVFTIDIIGRRTMQLIGFGALTVLYIVIAAFYHRILETSVVLFIVLYTVAQFFINFGPNVTTFIIPGEAFPTQWRATGHGISAACGKVGAFIASYAFQPVTDAIGIDGTIGCMAAFMFLGLVLTYFTTPETKGVSLDAVRHEDSGASSEKDVMADSSDRELTR